MKLHLLLGTAFLFYSALFLSAEPISNSEAKIQANLYQAGLTAVDQGNLSEAKQHFSKILQRNPQHAHARYQLLHLNDKKGRVAINARKSRLKQVTLTKVSFDGLSVADAVDGFNHLVSEATGNSFSPNLVLRDPQKKLASKKISLELQSVPAHVALNYIAENMGASLKYDEFAVILSPLPTTASPN